MNSPFVVVISGVTAGGKTTLINELHNEYPLSKILSFDDYNIDQLPSAPKIDTPIAKAVDKYDISKLMEDFMRAYKNYPLILIDFPFGNKHQELYPFIDLTVYIKTPLDVVLARQVIRDYESKSKEDIIGWMKQYINFARPIFTDFEEYISNDADYILDGLLTLEVQVEQVKNFIMEIKRSKGQEI